MWCFPGGGRVETGITVLDWDIPVIGGILMPQYWSDGFPLSFSKKNKSDRANKQEAQKLKVLALAQQDESFNQEPRKLPPRLLPNEDNSWTFG